MAGNNVIIKISRDKYIESSKEVALVKLDSTRFSTGQEYMVNYYTDSTRTTIDSVVAIGIRNGIGRGCYKIEYIGDKNYVWGVVTQLPDISKLVHGEIYLYHDKINDIWYLVYSSDGVSRTVTPISDTPKTYFDLATSNFWVSNINKKVWCLNDICTVDEVNKLIEKGGGTVIKYVVEFDSLTPEQKLELKGDPGYTPQRGIDYWTSEDELAIEASIIGKVDEAVNTKLSWKEIQ